MEEALNVLDANETICTSQKYGAPEGAEALRLAATIGGSAPGWWSDADSANFARSRFDGIIEQYRSKKS